MLERYFVFAGFHYYPSAGFGDLVGIFPSEREAIRVAGKQRHDWVLVYVVRNDGARERIPFQRSGLPA